MATTIDPFGNKQRGTKCGYFYACASSSLGARLDSQVIQTRLPLEVNLCLHR
jgi:hypothetical protein